MLHLQHFLAISSIWICVYCLPIPTEVTRKPSNAESVPDIPNSGGGDVIGVVYNIGSDNSSTSQTAGNGCNKTHSVDYKAMFELLVSQLRLQTKKDSDCNESCGSYLGTTIEERYTTVCNRWSGLCLFEVETFDIEGKSVHSCIQCSGVRTKGPCFPNLPVYKYPAGGFDLPEIEVPFDLGYGNNLNSYSLLLQWQNLIDSILSRIYDIQHVCLDNEDPYYEWELLQWQNLINFISSKIYDLQFLYQDDKDINNPYFLEEFTHWQSFINDILTKPDFLKIFYLGKEAPYRPNIDWELILQQNNIDLLLIKPDGIPSYYPHGENNPKDWELIQLQNLIPFILSRIYDIQHVYLTGENLYNPNFELKLMQLQNLIETISTRIHVMLIYVPDNEDLYNPNFMWELIQLQNLIPSILTENDVTQIFYQDGENLNKTNFEWELIQLQNLIDSLLSKCGIIESSYPLHEDPYKPNFDWGLILSQKIIYSSLSKPNILDIFYPDGENLYIPNYEWEIMQLGNIIVFISTRINDIQRLCLNSENLFYRNYEWELMKWQDLINSILSRIYVIQNNFGDNENVYIQYYEMELMQLQEVIDYMLSRIYSLQIVYPDGKNVNPGDNGIRVVEIWNIPDRDYNIYNELPPFGFWDHQPMQSQLWNPLFQYSPNYMKYFPYDRILNPWDMQIEVEYVPDEIPDENGKAVVEIWNIPDSDHKELPLFGFWDHQPIQSQLWNPLLQYLPNYMKYFPYDRILNPWNIEVQYVSGEIPDENGRGVVEIWNIPDRDNKELPPFGFWDHQPMQSQLWNPLLQYSPNYIQYFPHDRILNPWDIEVQYVPGEIPDENGKGVVEIWNIPDRDHKELPPFGFWDSQNINKYSLHEPIVIGEIIEPEMLPEPIISSVGVVSINPDYLPDGPSIIIEGPSPSIDQELIYNFLDEGSKFPIEKDIMFIPEYWNEYNDIFGSNLYCTPGPLGNCFNEIEPNDPTNELQQFYLMLSMLSQGKNQECSSIKSDYNKNKQVFWLGGMPFCGTPRLQLQYVVDLEPLSNCI